MISRLGSEPQNSEIFSGTIVAATGSAWSAYSTAIAALAKKAVFIEISGFLEYAGGGPALSTYPLIKLAFGAASFETDIIKARGKHNTSAAGMDPLPFYGSTRRIVQAGERISVAAFGDHASGTITGYYVINITEA